MGTDVCDASVLSGSAGCCMAGETITLRTLALASSQDGRRLCAARHAEVHPCPDPGDVRLDAALGGATVTRSDVDLSTAAEGQSESYVYAPHSRLAQYFSDAVHDGLVVKSPCSRRASPGAGKQRAYVATTEQVWSLHDQMPDSLRASVLLGAFAGLRLTEACGLRVADVNFMRGEGSKR